MPKSLSPVRLQDDLMRNATLAGARLHRSAAEQIEYWATLGQQIAGFVDPDSLLDIAAGLARLRVEPVVGQPVTPEAVFDAVESDRDSGILSSKVTSATFRYQASNAHPGYLERIDNNGVRTLGLFLDGGFVPRAELANQQNAI